MNYLIIYMSRHGTSEKVVNILKEKLGAENCSIVNLAKGAPLDLEKYNSIIVGGSIHVGQIQKEILKFCENHQETLLKKKLGLFICFMEKEKGQLEFDMAFPKPLREHATAKGLFGGELLFEKMNFIERTIIRKIKKVNKTVSEIDYPAIDAFAETISKS